MSNPATITTRSVAELPRSIRPAGPTTRSSRFLLGDLERPSDVFRHLGPNWFTSVMATGIVANAAALLPVHIAGLHRFAIGVGCSPRRCSSA